MEVLHQQRPPPSVLGLHDTALVGVVAARSIRTGGSHAKPRPVTADTMFLVTRHNRASHAVIAEGLVGLDDARLVGAPDALGSGAERAPVG